jgi:hypothetical protein
MVPFAASPTLSLRLEVIDPVGRRVHALILRTQIRIEPARRSYRAGEQDRMADLFGEPSRWGETLHSFFWTEVTTAAGPFTGRTKLTMPIACTYDFAVNAARYLHNLDEGVVPLLLLASGTIFRVSDGRLEVEPVSWHTETRFRLPVATWREAMDAYFPGGGWLRLDSDAIDALGRVKARHALPTWEQAVELLCARAGET